MKIMQGRAVRQLASLIISRSVVRIHPLQPGSSGAFQIVTWATLKFRTSSPRLTRQRRTDSCCHSLKAERRAFNPVGAGSIPRWQHHRRPLRRHRMKRFLSKGAKVLLRAFARLCVWLTWTECDLCGRDVRRLDAVPDNADLIVLCPPCKEASVQLSTDEWLDYMDDNLWKYRKHKGDQS